MRVLALLLLGLAACQPDPFPAPIEGTAYRISKDEPAGQSEVTIDILVSRDECVNAKVSDVERCVPFADRAAGELRLAFELRDPSTSETLFRALDKESVRVEQDDKSQNLEVEFIPHEPMNAGQLFILVIDGSGSMQEVDAQGRKRIDKVYTALMDDGVIDGFFPEGNTNTGVVLLRFSDKVVGLDGGAPQILKTPRDYRQMVQTHLLKPSGGYTHLYDALKYAVTDLLAVQSIKRFLVVNSAEPTVVMLTDGFNNEAADDTCGTNAERLQEALELVREVRKAGTTIPPTVYSVGLGQPYNAKQQKPDGFNQRVTVPGLCGPYGDRLIDAGSEMCLEDYGIDHISLEWMAESGGGRSFVKRDPKGLAAVFKETSAVRHRWYEVRLRVPDSFYHRKSFEVELSLQTVARAASTVMIHPHPFLDAPSGTREADDAWVLPTPLRRSLALLLPILGVLVTLMFVGPATFNVRRAIFRRARPRK